MSSITGVDGNVCKEPFYKKGEGEKKSFASFRLAVNTGKDETVFFPVKCFGWVADIAGSLKKGDKIVLNGRHCEDSYEKDGEKIVSIGIVADIFGVVPRKQEDEF
jgi:single-stranded DNA-binding protein